MNTKKTAILAAGFAVLTGIAIAAFLLFWNGIILLNNPSESDYPVRGVDVSHYQGDIQWQTLAGQGIDFAFIKATEGSTYVDDRFEYNLTEALKTDLRVGAYHFFSFDSGGDTQADNFISIVPKVDRMLPPVVDFEFYGDKASNPPDAEAARAQLDILLERLEEHYGKKPIIYCTEDTYTLYLQGYYDDYDLWYRDVIWKPSVPDGRQWTFWQYTNRDRLDGYSGEERFIDMNVFFGSEDDFASYGE